MVTKQKKPMGYWDVKERCIEVALMCTLRSEFKNLYPSAYGSAQRKGWLNECCAHMETKVKHPRGYWNKERCVEEALKCKSREEFKQFYPSAYPIAQRKGWLDECCAHMIRLSKPNGFWNKERCIEEALKFNSRAEFNNKSKSAYSAAYGNGWLDECCAHMMIKIKKHNNKTIVEEFKKIHGDTYDYSLVNYINSSTKVVIKCKDHDEFEQIPYSHISGAGCPICSGNIKLTTESIIERFKNIHGEIYDYSLVEYNGIDTKIKIICPIHGEFEQTPYSHLKGSNCQICSGNTKLTTEFFIKKSRSIHGEKYDYSLVKYGDNYKTKVIIKCKKHGVFEQRAADHLKGSGCPVCNRGWESIHKLTLINELGDSDLLHMDPIELSIIIGQGCLPVDFRPLVNTEATSPERITTLAQLKQRFSETEETDINTEIESLLNESEEFTPIDNIDDTITTEISETIPQPILPRVGIINDLRSLDNSLYATMDEEAFESLIQYKLRKLWNQILNEDITPEQLSNVDGGKYFNIIKTLFFDEYNEVINVKPSDVYSFKYQPNLMQKLTVYRLIKNKSYGNWSGTGAGKTLSFILSSREIDAKLTLVIAINSTIEQTAKSIKDVYPNSLIFDEYKKGCVFDRDKHNYLILNYEKFQLENSEELFQSLTNNNQIDFIVVDEVHNAKQREEEIESIRRGVINRLFGRIRENNPNVYILVMSATPVINNLYEAKSLLKLMTGLEYDDLQTRRNLPNALKIFQQLILNGLRYIPKYDMNINELTGHNMSNLNIDGAHLLDKLLELSSSEYLEVEQLLTEDKLKVITPYLRKGVIIYSYYTTAIVKQIENYVKSLGFKCGTYTGEESTRLRSENIKAFKSGKLDVLIGSKPIGTGVDGLQEVCDRMIIITLPWTDSEYTQLKGRIFRQGSNFDNVEFIIPQVRIDDNDDGSFWSWEIQRLNLIKNKKTLADAAVDGVIPSAIMPSPTTMYKKAMKSLEKWKDRINSGVIITNKRNQIEINLYPEINNIEQRQQRIQSELSEFNRRGKTTHSKRMHEDFTKNPDLFFRYHELREIASESFEEKPYEYIASKIKNKDRIITDFGCGTNKFKTCVPNKVYSFDHVAYDETVTACDMRQTNLADESIDIAVFSLSLWGTNYKEYIKEAYRVLNYDGKIYIAEPAKNYDSIEGEQELINLITEVGFELVGKVENRGKFIYITGIKI